MFILRSLFWLTSVVMLLPPAADGEEPPRVSIIKAVAAARTLIMDLGAVCERNPVACETSGAALLLFKLKLETGVDIVAAGLAGGSGAQPEEPAAVPSPEQGTLAPDDLQPSWTPPVN
jgi:hypothetical protein